MWSQINIVKARGSRHQKAYSFLVTNNPSKNDHGDLWKVFPIVIVKIDVLIHFDFFGGMIDILILEYDVFVLPHIKK